MTPINVELRRFALKWEGPAFCIAACFSLLALLLVNQGASLNGDEVAVGLGALTIREDPTMEGYHLGYLDPYLFTDIYPGVLIQLATGYSPMALRLTGLAYGLFLVGSLGLLVWWLTRDRAKTALAVGLVGALNLPTLAWLTWPLYHNVTMALAILYAVYLYRAELKSWKALAPPLLLAPFIIYSDMFFVLLLVAPYTLYSLRERGKSLVVSLVLIAETVGQWYVKTGGLGWPFATGGAPTVADYPGELAYGLGCAAAALSGNVAERYEYFLGAGAGGWLILGLWLACAIIVALKLLDPRRLSAVAKDPKLRYVALVGLAGTSGMLVYFLVRTPKPYFLIYPELLLLATVAVGYRRGDLAIAGAMLAGLMLTICLTCSGALQMSTMDPVLADLAGHLEQNNLTYGYGDYWKVAGPLTYISKGEVHMLGATLDNDTIAVTNYFTQTKWYRPDGRAFVACMGEAPANHADEVLVYENRGYKFTVLVYDEQKSILGPCDA